MSEKKMTEMLHEFEHDAAKEHEAAMEASSPATAKKRKAASEAGSKAEGSKEKAANTKTKTNTTAQISMPKEQKNRFFELAREHGMTLSSFFRLAAEEYVKKNKW